MSQTFSEVAFDDLLILLLVSSTNDQEILRTYEPEELLKPSADKKMTREGDRGERGRER